MKLWPLFLTCLLALTRNPMRAALTVLGIVIGIAAVVAIMEIGEGSKKQISDSIASLGAGKIMVMGASVKTAGVSSGRAAIKASDAEILMEECSAFVINASPVVKTSAQVIVNGLNWSPETIAGGNEHYLDIESWKIAEGRGFDKSMVDNADRVCVVGRTIVKELFPDVNPIGQDIRIRDVIFKVIGVLEEKGAGHWGNDQDNSIFLPWTSIRMRLMGSPSTAVLTIAGAANKAKTNAAATFPSSSVALYPGTDLQSFTNAPHPLRTRTVNYVVAKIYDTENATPAMDAMTPVLRRHRGLKVGQLDDFEMRDSAQFSKMVTSTADTMSNLLLAVAMISLVVGGVGIMNIMMVSVTERTREIGLRMAVGARPRDIMSQFLLEAVLLCLVGGIIGILLGRLASIIVSVQNDWPVASSTSAIILSVSVAVIIGVVFGWYPAWKASRMDPIDALRHE